MSYLERRRAVAALLPDKELDAIVFFDLKSIRYLCGFSGTDGALIVTADRSVFLTDSRYTTQAEQEVVADSIQEYKIKIDGVLSNLRAISIMAIGFEQSLAYGTVQELQEKGDEGWRWLGLKDELETLRVIKDDAEIALLEDAAELNRQAFDAVHEILQPGIKERDFALELEVSLRRHGADGKAFDFIVASGERGALPHGIASDRVIGAGELVTIDFGCSLDGYHSDETVTLAVGEVGDRLREIFDLVLDAHDMAVAAAKPGVPLADLDRIARDRIREAGYDQYFGHGLGHGVGLDVHEQPAVSPRSKAIAAEGMVFTIEPGIYMPGLGGVRIEDTVVVTADGCRKLTRIPKTFRNILVN